MIGEAIYLLCALTSIGSAVLLVRGYRRSHARLILWCAIFFVCQSLTNIFLYIDLALFPTSIDLLIIRNSFALVGVFALLYGFVKDTK